MTFTTPTFLIFLAIVYLLYWAGGRKWQNGVILVGSLIFYGWWDWRFLILLLVVAGIDYLVALAMPKAANVHARRMLLFVSLVTNLGILGYFKYANFFIASFHAAMERLGVAVSPTLVEVILPVGISFYTFQALSYTIDVYRHKMTPVRSFVEYFCFITFFPHMVAGPIQQAVHLLVQFRDERKFDATVSADGLRQMLWGYFKKMVVADNLAPLVQAAYADPASESGWQLLWATYFFAFQIYCDFSGYTDIAIGCARLFSLHMTRNFAYPYFAENITEFWHRWHISLSTWFREYLYIPLGGNRRGPRRELINIFIVFVVSGLWHGANWTFVVWGVLHGLFYCGHRLLGGRVVAVADDRRRGISVRRLVNMLVTFHLALAAWVFFRADNVEAAVTILRKIAAAPLTTFVAPQGAAVFWIAALLIVEWLQRDKQHGLDVATQPRPVRWLVYYATAAAILLFAQLDYVPFIYFQF